MQLETVLAQFRPRRLFLTLISSLPFIKRRGSNQGNIVKRAAICMGLRQGSRGNELRLARAQISERVAAFPGERLDSAAAHGAALGQLPRPADLARI